MQKDGKRIAIYSRKSKFTGKGESVANQIELCRAYIRDHYGAEAVDWIRVFEDEGFTGGNLNRPGFKQMMEAAKKREFHTIVVYRLDRISRNIGDFSKLIDDLSRLGVDFVSINEQFDTGTPMGRAMMYIASVFSQLERETIAERIRDNMHELAKTGRWLGGNTPTGYGSESVVNVTVEGKTRKACKLKVIPEEAETVKLIFDLYMQTDSLTATETELLRRRIKTKMGNQFTRFSIKGILQNPVYMVADEGAWQYFTGKNVFLFSERADFDGAHGMMVYNRTDQEKGRATVELPMTEWIVAVGKHPGLIPSRQWIDVHNSLERNKAKGYRKPRRNEALLTGLLFCSCGGRMYPKLSGRTDPDGRDAYVYVCRMKERSRKSLCSQRNVCGNTLDEAVIGRIRLLEENPRIFGACMEQCDLGGETWYEEQLGALRKEQMELQKKINALVDSLAEMENSGVKSQVARRIAQLNQEQEATGQRICEMERLTSHQMLPVPEFELLRCQLMSFDSCVDMMSIAQKRAAIRRLISKVVWDGGNAHMHLAGADAEEAPIAESKTHWSEDSK